MCMQKLNGRKTIYLPSLLIISLCAKHTQPRHCTCVHLLTKSRLSTENDTPPWPQPKGLHQPTTTYLCATTAKSQADMHPIRFHWSQRGCIGILEELGCQGGPKLYSDTHSATRCWETPLLLGTAVSFLCSSRRDPGLEQKRLPNMHKDH